MHRISTSYYLALLTLLTTFNVIAQEQPDSLIDKAKALEKKYDSPRGVFESAESEISFEIKSEEELNVIESNSYKMISCRINNAMFKSVYYDEHSEIENVSVKDENGDPVYSYWNKTCGDYEISGIFHSDAKKCQYAVGLSMIGDQKSLEFTKRIYDPKYYTSVYFNESYPVEKRRIKILVPEDVDIEIHEWHLDAYGIQKETSDTTIDDKKLEVYIYSVNDQEAFKYQSYASSTSKTWPHLLIQIKSYTYKGTKVDVLSDLDDQYNWYASLVDSMENNDSMLKPIVEKLIAGKSSDEEKVKAIFYWVQDNIRYIAFEDGIAGFQPEEAQDVCTNKYGDCKGMANVTKRMMQLAGLDARLTWLGTNSIPYSYSTPSLAVDNHMICTWVKGEELVFLDATEKFNALYDVAERIQNREAIIEGKDNDTYELVKVPKLDAKRNEVLIEQQLSIDGMYLKGKGSAHFKGERKVGLMNLFYESESQDHVEFVRRILFGNNRNIELGEVEMSGLLDRDEELVINYNVIIENAVHQFGDKTYVEINQFDQEHFIEIEEDRKMPLYFKEKVNESIKIDLKIPTGLSVKSAPEDFLIDTEHFSLKSKVANGANDLSLEILTTINQQMIPKAGFLNWNEAFHKLDKNPNGLLILE